MRSEAVGIIGIVMGALVLAGCGGQTQSKASGEKLPWSRVTDVDVASGNGEQGENAEQASGGGGEQIGPGSSESEVIMAWGVPDYIQDSTEDPERRIWHYKHALVVFQGRKAEKIVPR